VAGFETTANTLVYAIYELARNPSIQERLVTELEFTLGELDPNTDTYYETVMTAIPYLEAVIKETLRKYPPLVRLTRRVGVSGYSLGGMPLEKDLQVEIPTYAVHHCPEYYPQPDIFNPDRFMPENRTQLKQYAFLPFGLGPRNCIGMRFAYQEIKLCLATVCRRFRFVATDQTPDRLYFKGAMVMLSSQLFDVRVEKR